MVHGNRGGAGNEVREGERSRSEERERERKRKDIVLAGRTSQRVGASVVGAYGPPLLCLVKWKVISNLLLSSFATGQCKYLGCRVRARSGYDATEIHKRNASSHCCISIIYDPRTPSPRVYPFHLRSLCLLFRLLSATLPPNARRAPFNGPSCQYLLLRIHYTRKTSLPR